VLSERAHEMTNGHAVVPALLVPLVTPARPAVGGGERGLQLQLRRLCPGAYTLSDSSST
jgi:hypothetical protein